MGSALPRSACALSAGVRAVLDMAALERPAWRREISSAGAAMARRPFVRPGRLGCHDPVLRIVDGRTKGNLRSRAEPAPRWKWGWCADRSSRLVPRASLEGTLNELAAGVAAKLVLATVRLQASSASLAGMGGLTHGWPPCPTCPTLSHAVCPTGQMLVPCPTPLRVGQWDKCLRGSEIGFIAKLSSEVLGLGFRACLHQAGDSRAWNTGLFGNLADRHPLGSQGGNAGNRVG